MEPGGDTFRPGVELSRVAEQKLRRAREHAAELSRIVEEWRSVAGLQVERRMSEDRHSVDLYARLSSIPDLDRLASIAGDVLHNLRTAHDAVVWDLAHVGGRMPRDEKRVHYPVCLTEKAWRLAARDLDTVPEVALERIRRLQPFTDTDDPEWQRDTPLNALHVANIHDKHRAALACTVRREEFTVSAWTFRGQPEYAGLDGELTFVEADPDADPTAMEPFLTLRSGAPFGSTRLPLHVRVHVLIRVGSAEPRPLLPFIATLVVQTQFNLYGIYYGVETARELIAPQLHDRDAEYDLLFEVEDLGGWDQVGEDRWPIEFPQ